MRERFDDAVKELDPARAAGMQTGLCEPPGNPPPAASLGHVGITDFSQIALA